MKDNSAGLAAFSCPQITRGMTTKWSLNRKKTQIGLCSEQVPLFPAVKKAFFNKKINIFIQKRLAYKSVI